jgi:hypothetical protein
MLTVKVGVAVTCCRRGYVVTIDRVPRLRGDVPGIIYAAHKDRLDPALRKYRARVDREAAVFRSSSKAITRLLQLEKCEMPIDVDSIGISPV